MGTIGGLSYYLTIDKRLYHMTLNLRVLILQILAQSVRTEVTRTLLCLCLESKKMHESVRVTSVRIDFAVCLIPHFIFFNV